MAWTSKQKQIAVRACRAAGITEEQRVDMILRHFRNAHHGGTVTSTSPKLTNHDFEAFMAIVERHAGGTVMHFTAGFWQREAGDHLKRMRFRARRIAAALEAAGKLAPDGAGLAGWIRKRVTGGETDQLEHLDYNALLALILGLTGYAKQHGVSFDP